MKIAYLYTLFLVATIINVLLKCFLFVLRYTSKQIFRLIRIIEKQQKRLLPEQKPAKEIKKEEKKKDVVADIPKEKASSTNTLIVGESKTTFMSELPVLRVPEEKEIEPFKSEPLAIIIEEEEEPDLVDFDVERSPDFDDDETPYYYADADDDFDNPMNSSGVSFEELSQTIEVLSKDDPTDKEKGEAAQVLNSIENTELFQFITINNSVYNNAKVLIALFNSNRYESADDFNINRYME